jgi:hypothetical protein
VTHCHAEVPRTPATHQAEPSARCSLKQLQDTRQAQHPDGWASIGPRHTGIVPVHSEALCGPPSCIEVPGSSEHAMCCLTGQHRWGPVGKAATTGQAGWVVPLGIPGSLQLEHLATVDIRFAAEAAAGATGMSWRPLIADNCQSALSVNYRVHAGSAQVGRGSGGTGVTLQSTRRLSASWEGVRGHRGCTPEYKLAQHKSLKGDRRHQP